MTEIARREYWERNLEFANRAQEYAYKYDGKRYLNQAK